MMKNITQYFLTFFFFLFSVFSLAYGQNIEGTEKDDNTLSLTISFEESINKNFVNLRDLDLASWNIRDATDRVSLSEGVGETLYSYVFTKPGSYEIEFTMLPHDNHAENCTHESLPNKLFLEVSASAIKYNFDNLKLSKSIVGGQDVIGSKLLVPVELKNFEGKDVVVPTNVYSSGINTTIIGSLDESQKTLVTGKYTLTYNLRGIAKKDTYISFDFEDSNGNNHTYYHLQKIQ